MYNPCDKNREGCPYYTSGCRQNTHHLYYPRHDYKTKVERIFRDLPENKVQLCMDEHDEIHATELPPVKPPRDEMLLAIGNSAINVTKERVLP